MIDIETEAAIIVRIVDRLTPGVGGGDEKAITEAAVELYLHRLVARVCAHEAHIGHPPASELVVQRLAELASPGKEAGIEVIDDGNADAAVGHPGRLQGDVTGRSPLPSAIPAGHVRIVLLLCNDHFLLLQYHPHH